MTFYNQHSTALVGAAGQPQGHFLEDSLRLRSSASAYLSRTPASAGNRTTWTYSGWVKRATSGAVQTILMAGSSGTDYTQLYFNSTDVLVLFNKASNVNSGRKYTTALYRDPSAWYHIVAVFDTTNATANDRMILYVNGSRITSFSVDENPTLNQVGQINNNVIHAISQNTTAAVQYLDGYLTEVNFIDGQALDPSYFGETDTVTGVWKPIEYTGSYGTNGFYLPMTPTSQAEGFNTVLYKGNGATQSITGVGFAPDLVWAKNRAAASHGIYDSVRGTGIYLASNLTTADTVDANSLTAFNADGFSLGSTTRSNTSGDNYVAWCWDAGSGSPVSNTDGTITSTVKANQAKGFSVVTYTGNSIVGATVGHGLGAEPKIVIIKSRSNGYNWVVGAKAVDGFSSGKQLYLNSTTGLVGSENFFANTQPTSSVFSIKDNFEVNYSGHTYVAYCFSEVAGYSKFGSYTGTGASGNSITTGFKPAWLLIKRTDSADKWTIRDCVRSPFNPVKQTLNPYDSGAEYTPSGEDYDFNSNGFTLNNSNGAYNASGGTYIYMAFADTRDTAFNNDASGNKNNWTPNNINSNASGQSTYDLMKDVPTLTDANAGNFCTLNPNHRSALMGTSASISDGNLASAATVGGWAVGTTAIPSSGKYYFEVYANAGNTTTGEIGILNPDARANGEVSYVWNSTKRIDGSSSSYGSGFTNGDTIGVAVDVTGGSVTFYKNNSSQGAISYTFQNNIYLPYAYSGDGRSYIFNFGQRPFVTTPPSGYKALNTYNLPDPTIEDGSEHFNTVLYTGTGSSRSVTGVGFQPDLVWIKSRSNAENHNVDDAVRGAGKWLASNLTQAETNDTGSWGVSSFDSDGFSIVNNGTRTNASGYTYAAWCWKANGSGVSNTDGSITSTVSANTSSGFSVATYTGTGSAATIGHGLGIAPSMLIVKRRSDASTWAVYHASIGAGKKLELNGTSGQITNAQFFPSTPTSSVFSLGTEYDVNGSGGTFVCYAFATIAGYSSFGSYVGNGNADGTFVYLGFRPAVVISKKSSGIGDWQIQTSDIPGYNVVTKTLFPNYSIAEATNPNLLVDFVSNGFKWRATSGNTNGNGDTFIYAAFAENPFKYSLAR